jgi:DNA repair exonuclease SbcCD ATPase subunit
MIKKLLFWSALAVGGLVLVNTVKPGAISTWGKRAYSKIEKKFSPEFELARIKDQIKELTPDMHNNITRIADEWVQVKHLEVRVNDMQAKLNEQKEVIQVMTSAIEKGEFLKLGGRTVTPTQIKDKLRKYRDAEKSFEVAKKTLEARKEALESARLQLAEIKNQKEALQLQAQEFETELAALKLAQTKSKFALTNDDRLSEIKEAFEQLRQRVEAERKKVELAGEFFGTNGSSVKEEKALDTADDVINEVRATFAEKADAAKK